MTPPPAVAEALDHLHQVAQMFDRMTSSRTDHQSAVAAVKLLASHIHADAGSGGERTLRDIVLAYRLDHDERANRVGGRSARACTCGRCERARAALLLTPAPATETR